MTEEDTRTASAGFRLLAPKDPEWSVAEFERCVKELGFNGWNTHSNFGDSYLDDPKYWPILAKAEEMDVPIYLHPAVPMIKELNEFGMVLAGPTLGLRHGRHLLLHADGRARACSTSIPNLKIIMGHLGEALPFLVNRVNRAWMQQHQSRILRSARAPKSRPATTSRRTCG